MSLKMPLLLILSRNAAAAMKCFNSHGQVAGNLCSAQADGMPGFFASGWLPRFGGMMLLAVDSLRLLLMPHATRIDNIPWVFLSKPKYRADTKSRVKGCAISTSAARQCIHRVAQIGKKPRAPTSK
jgi:hypothetical protein